MLCNAKTGTNHEKRYWPGSRVGWVEERTPTNDWTKKQEKAQVGTYAGTFNEKRSYGKSVTP